MNNVTEKWARTAPAGPELDRVVAGWMGLRPHRGVTITVDGEDRPLWSAHNPWEHLCSKPGLELASGGGDRHDAIGEIMPPPFSTDWSAAGPLLEAMGPAGFYLEWCDRIVEQGPWYAHCERFDIVTTAPTPCLAIARAVAVLVARGIERGELE